MGREQPKVEAATFESEEEILQRRQEKNMFVLTYPTLMDYWLVACKELIGS